MAEAESGTNRVRDSRDRVAKGERARSVGGRSRSRRSRP